MAAIQVTNIKKSYATLQALDGVSLSIEQGEFFGLLGPNGAGKTTLISIIAGLIRPSSGTVQVMGHDVQSDYRAARSQLGVVPQELVFDPFFTVRETLRMQLGYYGLKRNDDWIDEIMENLDLTNKADTNMRALSGGLTNPTANSSPVAGGTTGSASGAAWPVTATAANTTRTAQRARLIAL